RTKCKTMGVALNDAFTTLQAFLGGYYVNDFNRFGRTWQVNLQGDSDFRVDADAIKQLKVRNAAGQMVPLGTIASVSDVSAPVMITRYNTYPSAAINGNTAPGFSSGQTIVTMDALTTQELPANMKAEWTEITLLQILAGNAAILIFPICCFLVFLT